MGGCGCGGRRKGAGAGNGPAGASEGRQDEAAGSSNTQGHPPQQQPLVPQARTMAHIIDRKAWPMTKEKRKLTLTAMAMPAGRVSRVWRRWVGGVG